MSAQLTIRDTLRRLIPPWMSDRITAGFTAGFRYLYAHALMCDFAIQFAFEAIRSRFPSFAPSEALSLIGQDRRIRRGLNEPDPSYRARLLRWLQDWKRAGSAFAILSQLRAYLQTSVRLRIVTANGTWWTLEPDGTMRRTVTLPAKNWNWDGNAPLWARFWVIIYCDTGVPFARGRKFGDGHRYGDGFGTIGCTATLAQVGSIRDIVRQWKAAHEVCKNIVLAFDATMFDPAFVPGAPMPDGTWGHWSKLVGGTQVAARDARAVYWDGVLN